MAGFASGRWHAPLFASVLLTAAAGGVLAQERVGVSSAVNPQAAGTPPGGTTRQLVIGQDVVFNERITTSEGGQTQLLFLDESSMTVGPNSDLTIDQFVYDPRSGTGKLTMSATRGVLRYVGGKLSKQDGAVTVRTSTATLAVRGGAFIANVQPARTDAIFIFGNGLTVTGANNVSQTVRRPGFQITVSGLGAAPSAPSPVPPAQLAQLVQQLDGRAGGSGGATVVPTDTTVAQSGISQTVSGDLAGSVQQAVQNQVGTTTTLTDASNVSNALSTTTGQTNTAAGQGIECAISGGCSGQQIVIAPVQPLPEPPPPSPVTIAYTGRLKDTNGQGTARGFVDQSANGNVAYANGTLTFPPGAPQQGVFTGTIGGRVGTISFPLVPGFSSFGPQGTSSSLGNFTGTSFLSTDSDNTFFYANITPTAQPTERLFIYGGMPVNSSFYAQNGNTRLFAFTVQPDAALQSNIPFIRGQAGGNLPNASVSPFYIVAPPATPIGDTSTDSAARGLQVSIAINGQGANQQSAIAVTAGEIGTQSGGQPVFNGQLRGSSLLSSIGAPVRLGSAVNSMVDANGNSFYGASTMSGFVLDQGASTASEVPLSGTPTSYGFAQPALPAPVPTGVGTSRTTQNLSGSFGGLMYTTAQTNPYMVGGSTSIATDATNNRVQATLTGGAQSASAGFGSFTMQYGGLSGAAGAQAFIDNSTFAALESQTNPQQVTINGTPLQATGQLYLVSSGAAGVPTSLLPSGASFCQCQFLQWGYWGGDLSSSPGDPTALRIDRGHINTWVAGVATPLNDMNSLIGQQAVATYNGHAIGSVFNNGASYVAAGGFTGSYQFGPQTATMSVNNFDGRSFTVSGSAPLTGANRGNYGFSSTSPVGTATIGGSFYGPMAAETGGNFAFQSAAGLPIYIASGTYAGKK